MRHRFTACGLTFLLVCGTLAFAEDTPVPTILSVSTVHAKACVVVPTEHPETPFTLRAEPILRRQQNTIGNSLGYTFLWLESSGRPAALCDVFFFKNHLETRQMLNEWHSFSDQPLTAKGPGPKDAEKVFLNSPGPGLEWHSFPETDAPAEMVPARKLQMSRLVRRFKIDSRTHMKGIHHELRLLTTPIFTYESTGDAKFLCGTIYAFCVETDPECLISIEARAVAGGYEWQYAPTATTLDRLTVRLDDNQVWSADPPVFSLNSPHATGFVKEVYVPLTPGTTAK